MRQDLLDNYTTHAFYIGHFQYLYMKLILIYVIRFIQTKVSCKTYTTKKHYIPDRGKERRSISVF